MKRLIIIPLIVAVIIILSLPSLLSAQPEQDPSAGVSVDTDKCGEATFEFTTICYPEGYYYHWVVCKAINFGCGCVLGDENYIDGDVEEIDPITGIYPHLWIFTLTQRYDPGEYCIRIWVDDDVNGVFPTGDNGPPSGMDEWWDIDDFTVKKCRTSMFEEPGVWERDHEMQCYQVWVNGDNNFEFVFWWAYADNNWVQIYDMEDNLVWEIDFEKGDPHFVACLPDGMYTVKTFHEYGHILQEFMIGKP